MLILIHGQNILRGVLEEKATRVAEVVISSVKPGTLLAGKVLGVGGVGLTQQIAWFAITGYLISFLMPIIMKGAKLGGAGAAAVPTSAVAGVLSTMSPMVLGVAVAYFIVGFVFCATLYAAAGSMQNSEQEAQQAAAPVMVLIMSAWLCVNPVMLARPENWPSRCRGFLVFANHHAHSNGTDERLARRDRWVDHRCCNRIHFHDLALGANLSCGHVDVWQEAELP